LHSIGWCFILEILEGLIILAKRQISWVEYTIEGTLVLTTYLAL
jgi:hypothetical protein